MLSAFASSLIRREREVRRHREGAVVHANMGEIVNSWRTQCTTAHAQFKAAVLCASMSRPRTSGTRMRPDHPAFRAEIRVSGALWIAYA